MIWRDVGDGRCIAVKAHDVFQLKTRQFADHDAALREVDCDLAKRCTDVAADDVR